MQIIMVIVLVTVLLATARIIRRRRRKRIRRTNRFLIRKTGNSGVTMCIECHQPMVICRMHQRKRRKGEGFDRGR